MKALSLKQALVAASLVLTAAGVSDAELVAYEGFDYPSGSINGAGAVGDGWNGSWNGDNYTVTAGSLALPNNPLPTSGGFIQGASTTNRDFDEINFDAAGTYYVSYLASREGHDPLSGSNQYLDLHLRSGFTQKINSGMTSDHEFHVRDAGGDDLKTSGDQSLSEDVSFIVMKLTIGPGAGDDRLDLAVYDDGNDIPVAEPGAWLLSVAAADIPGNANKMTLWAGSSSGFSASFDEIRLATTWAEAVPIAVPEPGALGLGLVLASLAMFERRR